LDERYGVYAFLLNPQGRIQADMYVHNRGEYLLVDTDDAQVAKVLEIFDHYIIMDDVEARNSSEKLTSLGLLGPDSRRVLEGAGCAIPQLAPLQSVDLVWQQIGVTISRMDNPVVDGHAVWLAPEHVGTLWEALQNAGGTPVGSQALELFRIACGVPRYGQDIRERDLPQETEQARALNFNKGCYVGQEIVERIRSRGAVHRMFTGFKLSTPLAAPGAKLRLGDKEVGEITSTGVLPASNATLPVALGYVRRENGSSGTILEADDARATATAVPFSDIFQR
jgi:folate-binding protein YgfZ